MRVVIQRVTEAQVTIEGRIFSKIGKGLCIFFGVKTDDKEEELDWLARKIVNLRIFSDEEGKMNKSVLDIKGEIMIISQFTLYASTKKGNRPSFINAEKPQRAEEIYKKFIENIESRIGSSVKSGVFGEDMKIKLENDGPVTILMDTDIKW